MGKSVTGRGISGAAVAGLLGFLLGLPQLALAQTDPPKGAQAESHASGSAACSVRVIHATAGGSRFDAGLEPLRPQLTRPPLSSWTSFALLQQHELSIPSATPQTFVLPGEHVGVMSYEGPTEASGKKRLRLRLEIKDGAAKLLSTKFVINDSGTMLQAGLKHDKGLLVLGITCRIVS